MLRIALGVVVVIALGAAVLYALGRGVVGEPMDAGLPTEARVPAERIAERARVQRVTGRLAGVADPKQILFGDLHVHSTFSTDAFLASLPITGGEGARPVSDACDFARFCSALDFWSINDHALSITPARWDETVESVRQCDRVAGDASSPDVVAYLGWEWTQVGSTPEDHYGHRNVVLRDLEDDRIPTRPIAAALPPGSGDRARPSTWLLGLGAVVGAGRGGPEVARYFRDTFDVPSCPEGVPVRELGEDCIERAPTPRVLFEKLDDWGHEALVIPHGTTWGFYTPPGASWDKQLDPAQHDPERQRLVEIHSGHGNSEEYRSWRDVEPGPDGFACPEPRDDYLPSCWRAGEIIRERCLESGEPPQTCEERTVQARAHYVAAGASGHLTVPGQLPGDWGDAGQCRDCFLPAFNYRPLGSVQYMMALSNFDSPGGPLRFRFGFMASSDNHSARPGTGYKEFLRRQMTELRFGAFSESLLGQSQRTDPEPESRPFDREASRASFFGLLETERQASFFLTGGLVAVHADGRDRVAIWDALTRREVYGTSGPRILLWFDQVDLGTGERRPMGSALRTARNPTFQVRAVGSFEQEPGCPDAAVEALGADRVALLCGGECHHPSDRRRPITRIEVVRIRPQIHSGESVDGLVEDPWKVLSCNPDPAGCRVTFTDTEYETFRRDTVYYARAIEAPSPAVDHDGVACLDVPWEDDCLGEVEERAWSSPIFVDWSE